MVEAMAGSSYNFMAIPSALLVRQKDTFTGQKLFILRKFFADVSTLPAKSLPWC